MPGSGGERSLSGARGISPETCLLGALLLALFGILELRPITPHDFWWHVRTGALIAETGAIPSVDLFSFTRAGEPWVNQAWAMQLALYGIHAAGGPALVLFAHALTIALGYALLVAALLRHHGARAAALGGSAAILLGWANWAVRPQSFSFLAFGALVYLIERHRHGSRRALWGAVPLFALWSNAHGGFVFGALALVCYAGGSLLELARRRGEGGLAAQRDAALAIAAPTGAALLALALNPLGPLGLAHYLLGFLAQSSTLAIVQEFQPLTVRNADGWICAGSAVALLALLTRRERPALGADRIASLALFGLLALLSRRALPWLGFAAAPVLAWLIAATSRERSLGWLQGGARPALCLAAALLLAVLALPWLRPHVPALGGPRAWLSGDTPVAAMAELCTTAGQGARVYQALPFASYQTWACPELRVFQDTRFELYPDAQWRDYLSLQSARFDWSEIAERHALSHLFLSLAEQSDLAEAAARSGAWVERYRDAVAVIFERAR